MLFTPKVLAAPCAESEMKWYWGFSCTVRTVRPASSIAPVVVVLHRSADAGCPQAGVADDRVGELALGHDVGDGGPAAGLEYPGDLTEDRRLVVAQVDDAVADDDLRIILVCNQGYQSSLAAATLQQLGLIHATDLDGGFTAWAAAGLPVTRPPAPAGRHTSGDPPLEEPVR